MKKIILQCYNEQAHEWVDVDLKHITDLWKPMPEEYRNIDLGLAKIILELYKYIYSGNKFRIVNISYKVIEVNDGKKP